jgi:hypothetical protein
MRAIFAVLILFWAVIISHGQSTNTVRNTSLPSFNPPNPNPQFNMLNYGRGNIDQMNRQTIEQDIRNYELQRQQRDQALKEAYEALGIEEIGIGDKITGNSFPNINYNYPENKAYGKTHYEKAFKEIMDMVERRSPNNLKRAVFLTEHAYDTTLSYPLFERQIAKLVEIIQLQMKKDRILPNDNMGKIMTVFKFMADTVKVRNPVTEKMITTYPKVYDFEDFYGTHDYHKMLVSKLIRTGKGQCHSLPLLFLILAQETNTKAYLSFAPEHTYVKFMDKTGVLQNIELTNQMMTTDQFVLQSGFIKSAAVKNRIYMDTLGMDKIILSTLGDLSNSYVKKYGYDDFDLKLAETVLARYPSSIVANMHAANYYNILDYRIKQQYDKNKMNQIHFRMDEKFQQVRRKTIMWNKRIDDLGWAEMPPDIYAKWLGLLKTESMRQQFLDRKRMLTNMIEH